MQSSGSTGLGLKKKNFSLKGVKANADREDEERRKKVDILMTMGAGEDEFIINSVSLVTVFKLTSEKDLKRIKNLGKGASASVDLVEHIPTGRQIALKQIKLTLDENFETFIKYLETEIDTHAKCQSPNIVGCYGFYKTSNEIHIGLEFMDLGTLTTIYMKVGPISHAILGGMTLQILKGLLYLHKTLKRIHRDIKPSNILCNREGEVKLSDFGIAKKISTDDYTSTWIGTSRYMSPECLEGKEYQHGCDVWCLGVSILECAIGKFPFNE